jgi:hypothetical protein
MTRTIERIANLHRQLDRQLQLQIERVKAELAAKLEAAEDVGAAAYKLETATTRGSRSSWTSTRNLDHPRRRARYHP